MRVVLLTCTAALLALGTARAGDLSDREIADARKLYNAKCAKCHKFYDPGRYTEAQWSDWMARMSRKSKLKPAQEELLARYLETFRTGGATRSSASSVEAVQTRHAPRP